MKRRVRQGTGIVDQAAAHFEDSVDFFRKGGYGPVAWTCRDYAITLLDRNHQGGRAMATFLVDESLAIQRTGYAAVDGAGAVPVGGIG